MNMLAKRTAAEALRTAAARVGRALDEEGYDAPDGEYLGALYEFCEVLFHDGTLQALKTVIEARRVNAQAHASSTAHLVDRCAPYVSVLHDQLLEAVTAAGEPHASAVSVMITAEEIAWRGGIERLGTILKQLKDPNSLKLSASDLSTLRTQLGNVSRVLDHLDTSGAPAVMFHTKSGRASIETACQVVDAGLAQLAALNDFGARADISVVRAELQEIHQALREYAQKGLRVPLPTDSALGRCLIRGYADRIAQEVARLAELVAERLEQAPARSHVFIRLCTYLEQFAGKEIVERIAAVRAAPTGSKRGTPEDVVQSIVDRFVFLTGLFPITHCQAGPGSIDTFVDERANPLLSQAATGGQRPLLLELKQAVASGRKKATTAGEVADKARNALDQAEQYSRHLKSNPLWADHEVYVVVVYDGKKRFKVARGDVRLVYVGDEPPSTPPDKLSL